MSETITVGGADAKEIQVDGIKPRTESLNLADEKNKELVSAVSGVVEEHISSHESLLEAEFDELDYYDYMFRCGRNTTEKANNTPVKEPTASRSDVGASMFFRQVMQSAAKTYSLQHGRDAFLKYSPISTHGVPYSQEDGKLQAVQLNTLAQWNLDQIGFDENVLMPHDIMVAKQGVSILLANWDRRYDTRRFRIPAGYEEGTGTYKTIETEEIEVLVKNQLDISMVNVSACRFDPTIGTIEDQECFAITNIIGMREVVGMVKAGYWTQETMNKLTESTRWDGQAGDMRKSSNAENADITEQSNDKTGKFLLWRIWINLPIDDSGKLDEKTVIPQRYICDYIGNTISDAVCMRIERNDDPDDEIPAIAVFDYPDSSGRFFHISKGHVLKNNYAVETTVVNQMLDNSSLKNNLPTVERKGAVVTRPKAWGRGVRFVVRNSATDDIREMSIGDNTQTSLAILNYIKEDSKMAIHTDPAQMGEGLGARATATEASGVMKLSAAPSVMNAQYITKQTFSWIGRKFASYVKAFSLPEQVIQITDSKSPIQDIRPSEIYGQFDVRVDVVDEVVNDIMEENKISQDFLLFSQNQALGAMVDMKGLLEEYFIRRYKKSFISGEVDFDARSKAAQENEMMMREGIPAKREEGQNDRIHLESHRAEKLRYMGIEDTEIAQHLELVDKHILEHVAGEGAQQQGGQQVPATPAADGMTPQGGAGTIPAAGVQGGTPPTVGAVTQKAVAQ